MSEKENTVSCNPNICASCSTLALEVDEYKVPESSKLALETITPPALEQVEDYAAPRSIRCVTS